MGFEVNSTHIEALKDEKQELLRILNEVDTEELSEDVRAKVEGIINLLNGSSEPVGGIICPDVKSVKNSLSGGAKDKKFLQESANKILHLIKHPPVEKEAKEEEPTGAFQKYLDAERPTINNKKDLINVFKRAYELKDTHFEDIEPLIKEWRKTLPRYAFILALQILKREKKPNIGNLDMLRARYRKKKYFGKQARHIKSVKNKARKSQK